LTAVLLTLIAFHSRNRLLDLVDNPFTLLPLGALVTTLSEGPVGLLL